MLLANAAVAALLAGIIPVGSARPAAATPEVFVLSHPVTAGTTLTIADFRLREAGDPPSMTGSVRPADAAGFQATHNLAAGRVVRFHGTHQAGITTRQQKHAQFAAFDLETTDRHGLRSLLRRWSGEAAAMTGGADARIDDRQVDRAFGKTVHRALQRNRPA